MAQPTYIRVPASTADKLANLGRAMLELAQELRQPLLTKTLVKPKKLPKDQEWFWSDEWQKGEREADEALARGEYKDFDNVEDLIADLHSQL